MGNNCKRSKANDTRVRRCEFCKFKWQIISSLCCTSDQTKSGSAGDKNNTNLLLTKQPQKCSADIGVEFNESNGSFVKMSSVCLNSPLPQVSKHAPPLYPPGKILHIVRKYPQKNAFMTSSEKSCTTPQYQVIEADNKSFNELLISPRMLQDHMPHAVLSAMKAVLDEQKCYINDEGTRVCSENGAFDTIDSVQTFENQNTTTSKPLFLLRTKSEIQKDVTSLEQLREFKAISLISYENIDFAPLAKPESLSDITSYEEMLNSYMFNNKNPILKLQTDSPSNDVIWWTTQDGAVVSILNEVNHMTESLIVKTSTPRDNDQQEDTTDTTIPESLSLIDSELNMNFLNNTDVLNQTGNSTNSFEFCNNIIDIQNNIGHNNDVSIENSVTSKNTNLISLEKLGILKPQSNDYILCFDMSTVSSTHGDGIKNTGQDASSNTDYKSGFDSGLEASRFVTSM